VPFARELAALDDVSEGRAVLGIGAGGTGHDARVLGGDVLPPAARAARLEEFVDVLDRVLTGDHVSYRGTYYMAVDARTTLPCVQRPRLPFVVAANGPRLMRLAASHGAGWATTGGTSGAPRAEGEDAWWRGLAELADRFSATLAEAGRDPASVDRLLSLDAAGTFALSSVGYFTDAVGRAAALGFTDVVVHWPLPGAPVYDAPEAMLDAVAEAMPALR
jgi:alkanesulfonate monooxygenase SsuD/methylene tetrahydromethanopterin reductase-like flavin-dependent oxidoreductase (luciferase family)